MVKRLTKHGNSLALVIDRPILDLLGIEADTPLAVTTDGNCLVVSKARNTKRQRAFRSALEKVNRRHGVALRQLAE